MYLSTVTVLYLLSGLVSAQYYISYATLNADRVPCSNAGGKYYICNDPAPADKKNWVRDCT